KVIPRPSQLFVERVEDLVGTSEPWRRKMSINGISSPTTTPPISSTGTLRRDVHHAVRSGGMAGVASYLNMSPRQLAQDLESGQTLASLATANGGTLNGVAQAFINGANSRVNALVSGGTITQTQANNVINGETNHLN